MSNEGDTSTQRHAKEPTLDCYAILGVHPNAEDVVIRAAFKALAQRYHPDRFSGSKEEAHRRTSDLTHAYEILCDPVRRGKYDRRRRLKAVSATYQLRDARENAPDLTIASPVTEAARQRRYRQAVVALVGVVVVLSAFNLYQYSGQLKSWIGSSWSATPTPGAMSRGAAETPIPIVTNTSIDPPVELPVVRPKSPPLAPTGSARAIAGGAATGDAVAPNAPAAIDPAALAPAARTPPRAASVEPARSAAPPAPAPAPAPRRDAPVASANPPVASANPPAASANPPAATASPPLAPAKAPAAKSAAAAVESLGVAPGGSCTDAVIALGLCKTDTTAAKAP